MVEHTKQAFKLDTEGRRRRTVGEDYIERSRESGKQIVETVASMLPGVGTAMTAEEIREELQREDPDYRKIALLGGAELVGLIPGLGTTAKAGLRKVADRVGAGKIVEALDAPKPKPESTMIEESKIISFTKKKEDKELRDFNKNLTSSISEQASKQAKLVEELQEVGIYGDYQKGARIQGKNYKGETLPPYTITSLGLNKVKLNNPNLKRTEDRLKIKFEYIEKDGDYYLPMLNVEQADGTKSQVYLDALKQRNTPIMGGPKDTVKKEMISVFPKPERMFPEESRPKGGDYLNPATGEVLSGRNVSSAKLSISPEGKPSFKVSNDDVETVGSTGKGKTQIKTNLFKKKAGWKWTKAPEGMENIGTLISVQNKGKHFYTVETDFSKGVNLKKYPDSKTEPRLRPTVVGELEIGPQIGTISVRGKEHPVYQNIKTFNKGGTAMKKQMEMAFMQQGGLKDDGMKVDPVSGNEIPPGSMAKEVRDDIPAQLSEGEYVVPADVVQYYGVKHFEDLRDKAKGGLNQMEADGRIGGEPISKNAPQMQKPVETIQASPYTQTPPQMAMDSALTGDELQEIQKMVEGGMVQPMMANPYEQQRTMYKQPQQMNVGGPVVNTPPAPTQGYSASPFISSIGTGFSFERPTQPAPVEVQQTPVTLYGPNGEVVTLMLPKQQAEYDHLLSQGYSLTAPTPTTQPARDRDDDGGGGPPPPTAKSWYETTDFTSGKEGGKASAEGYFGKPADFGAGLVGLAGAAIGGIPGAVAGKYGVQVSNLASARAEVVIRTAMGDTTGANALQAAINAELKASSGLGLADKAIDAVFGSDGDMKVIDALVAAGIEVDRSLRDDDLDKFMEDLRKNRSSVTKLQNKFGDKTITPDSGRKKGTDVEVQRPTVTTAPRREPRDDDYSASDMMRDMQSRQTQAASVAESEGVSAPTSGGARSVSTPTGNVETYASTVERGGGFNKGGLMQKKKKK